MSRKYEEANQLVNNGSSVVEAAKKHGLTAQNLYNWRHQHGHSKTAKKIKPTREMATKPTTQETVISLPIPERVLCVIGTPKEIAEVIVRTRQTTK